jgi:hypothetical protein
VFDLFTGEPVVISDVPQIGLDVQDADELAELLDHKAFANAWTTMRTSWGERRN